MMPKVSDMRNGSWTLPPRYGWTEDGSFGSFTVKNRFPGLLGRLHSNEDIKAKSLSLIERWLGGLDRQSLDAMIFEHTTNFVSEKLIEYHGREYKNMSFIFIEFLFYNLINKQVEFSRLGQDPFAKQKHAEMDSAIEMVGAVEISNVHSTSFRERVETLLKICARGNAADLSQLIRSNQVSDEKFVINDLGYVARRIADCRNEKLLINIIADNAGSDLFSDMLLIDGILTESDYRICLHVKPWPMFVSDATKADFFIHLNAMKRSSYCRIANLAARLELFLNDDRLLVGDSEQWGEPRDIIDFSPGMISNLDKAFLNISKGDLNYRRYFQDRTWDHYTPVEVAAAGLTNSTLLLRIIKSEILVGCTNSIVDTFDRDWTRSGAYGVAQKLNF